MLVFDRADETRSIKRARHAADSEAHNLIEVRRQCADRNSTAPYDKRERQGDEAHCEIERNRCPCWISDDIHQDRQAKFAAAQSDGTRQGSNWNAPSKRLLKIGTADSRLDLLFFQ